MRLHPFSTNRRLVKRPFLLFEALLALLLLAICIVPLVTQPLRLYRKEMKDLELVEFERLADLSFAEVKEKLLRNEIPWKQIPKKGADPSRFSLSAKRIHIPGLTPKKVERAFTLACTGEKTGLANEEFRQLCVTIYLNKEKYRFRTPVQKIVLTV